MKRFGTERERLEYEAFIRKDKEEQERPVKQAKARLERTAGELLQMQRKALLDIVDKDFYVNEALRNARMTIQDAQAFNKTEAEAFAKENPDYYPSRKNFELLSGYMAKNGIDICSRDMWKAAYEKFKSAGLLETPQPESIPEAIAEPQEEPELPRLPAGWVQPSGWQREPDIAQIGIDLNTGEERSFSPFEIERMTAEQYKRTFRLSVPALTRTNFQR